MEWDFIDNFIEPTIDQLQLWESNFKAQASNVTTVPFSSLECVVVAG